MKNLETWFEEYSGSHQNPLNKKIHLVCVPAIFFSVSGIIFSIHPFLAFTAIIAVTLYYLLLDFNMGAIMLIVSAVFFWIFSTMESIGLPVFSINLFIFIAAWIGQFYGHKVEGKKPSFLTDLAFLFIGPLWVLRKVMTKFKV